MRDFVRTLSLLGFVGLVAACTSGQAIHEAGSCPSGCDGGEPNTPAARAGGDGLMDPVVNCPSATDGVKDCGETDVDCGGANAPKCTEGKSCLADGDCTVACNYAMTCVSAPSCVAHLGGDTCGLGEVESPAAPHESCCRTLAVTGYTDPMHPGKTVMLDKYEVTAGRVRAWVASLAAANGDKPDLRSWIAAHRPAIWNDAWNTFLPGDYSGPSVVIARRLLGDPRPEDNGDVGPPATGVILPPPTDQPRNMGFDYQFGTEVYVDLHGSDCGTWDGSYGFATYWYPPNILAHDAEKPRADGLTFSGTMVAAKDLLDVKAMNCITNEMLAAFCAWDGGQLATTEVLDYVTQTPPSLGNISGCGTQIDDHGELLANVFTHTVQSGGACPPVALINATFDAGDNLPEPGSPLNMHNYHYPDLGDQAFDKAWEVAAPGRASLAPGANGEAADVIRLHAGDEPWMDLAGNLSEAAFETSGGSFTGRFALKYRGVGYGSSRSDLNMTYMKGESILRLQRPEAKAAYIGGRCMRFH
jgi:hypothetical protein